MNIRFEDYLIELVMLWFILESLYVLRLYLYFLCFYINRIIKDKGVIIKVYDCLYN